MNRLDRLMALLLQLQGRRLVTGEQLARHFGISVRTVYRDLAALGEAGVPIAAEAGVGYSLVRGFHLPPVMFTDAEAQALATGAALVEEMTDPSLCEPMRSALAKIRAVLPRDRRDRVEALERSLALRARTAAETRGGHLLALQEALAQRQVVLLVYRGAFRDEVTEREVEPLGLTHYLERWHLIGWCRLRGDVRDFRTDRIERLAVREERFLPRPGVSLDEHLGRLMAPEPGITARVRFHRRLAEKARREWNLGILAEEPDGDGVVLTLSAGKLVWLAHWLLAFGTAATVLDPAELRDRLAEVAAATLAHHQGQS